MKQVGRKITQYQVFEEYVKIIKKYKKVNEIVGELKTEAMKLRHWKDLMQKLHL